MSQLALTGLLAALAGGGVTWCAGRRSRRRLLLEREPLLRNADYLSETLHRLVPRALSLETAVSRIRTLEHRLSVASAQRDYLGTVSRDQDLALRLLLKTTSRSVVSVSDWRRPRELEIPRVGG